VTYTFDTADGFFKSGAAAIAWPGSFVSFSADSWGEGAGYSSWQTSDIVDGGISYGGVPLNFEPPTGWHPSFCIYWSGDDSMSAAHPTTTVSTGLDAALSGTVLMQSGSSIVLSAGSNWARNITVGTAS
jgi:hypothetical protein